ncbi:MAG: hypothetical protein GC162_12685 [Planctomycetes bacterium]|nr:hypothetical protein [Planctomycetota bacterium]
MKDFKTSCVIAMLAISLTAATSRAATVFIDWSSAAAVSNPDANGNYWNSIGTGTSGVTQNNLLSSTGVATSWNVSVGIVGTSAMGFSGSGAGLTGRPAPFNVTNATTDGIFANRITATATITFTGLTPNANYSLSLVGGRVSSGDDGAIAVITGTGSGGTLKNDGTLLNLSIVADASGTIAFTFKEAGAIESSPANIAANFNAMSITAAPVSIPLPAAMPAGLALLSLLAVRRR